MKPSLLKSFFYLTVIYYIIGLLFWFNHNQMSIIDVSSYFDIFVSWSIPMFLAPIVAWLIGFGVSYSMKFIRTTKERDERIVSDSVLTVDISLGKIPKPTWLLPLDEKKGKISLRDEGEMSKILEKLPEGHLKLFDEISNVLHQNPEAFVGPGHTETLLKHSMNVLEEAVRQNHPLLKTDPLAPIAVLAHDIGKILSHKKNAKGKWVKTGKKEHDTLSGMIVSSLESFKLIGDKDGRVLVLVLKYTHKPFDVPILEGRYLDQNKRIQGLLDLVKKADKIATGNEKKEIAKKVDKDTLFQEHFLKAANQLHWHNKSAKKGAKMSCWRNGGHIFIREIAIREEIVKNLSPELKAAFNNGARNRGQVSDFSVYLAQWLKKKKWLVTDFDEKKSENGLWNIKAGSAEINGVFYLKPSDDFVFKLPESATYAIEVLSPVETKKVQKKVPAKQGKVTAKDVVEVKAKMQENRKRGGKKGSEKPPAKPPAQKEDNSAGKARRKPKPVEKPKRERPSYYDDEQLKSQNALIAALENPFKHTPEEVQAAEEALASQTLPYLASTAWIERCDNEYALEMSNPYFIAMAPQEVKERPRNKKLRSKSDKKSKAMIMASLGIS